MIIVRRQVLTNIGKAVHMEEMTDKQFDKILKMVSMILDGCKDLDEAKERRLRRKRACHRFSFCIKKEGNG